MLTEEVNDSLCFAEVAHRGRSSVYVDVVHIVNAESSIFNRTLHHQVSTEALWVSGSDVVSVGTGATAHYFSINLGTASQSVFEFLENEANTTFAHHEAIA